MHKSLPLLALAALSAAVTLVVWRAGHPPTIDASAGAYGDCKHDDWQTIEDNIARAFPLIIGRITFQPGCYYLSRTLIVPPEIFDFDGGGATFGFTPNYLGYNETVIGMGNGTPTYDTMMFFMVTPVQAGGKIHNFHLRPMSAPGPE